MLSVGNGVRRALSKMRAAGILPGAEEGRVRRCPHPDYADAYIVLPDVWLGKHLIAKGEAMRAAERWHNVEITETMVALMLVEEFHNIPGIEGRNPESWQVDEIPIEVISWLTVEVLSDFNQSFAYPKASSSPSPRPSTEEEATGASKETPQ